MKVIRLTAENFLRLRAIDITPKDDVVKVSGANGSGKTSTLDAIWAALDHTRLAATEPIHRGATKAVIHLNLGDIEVERVITKKGTELKVTRADGQKVPSPQRFLDSMLGELTFDPLAFDRMQPRDQFEQLRRAMNIDYDFKGQSAERQRLFDQRTEVTRQAKAKRAQAEGYPAGGPTEQLDDAPILARIAQAAERARAIEEARQQEQSLQQHANTYNAARRRSLDRIAKLKAEIAEEEKKAAEYLNEENMALEKLAALPDAPEPVDVTAEQQELQRVRAHNDAVGRTKMRAGIEKEAAELEARAEGLTEQMVAIDKAKEAVIAQAAMPVVGLDLGDGMVTYNGLPYAQASSAERLRISMGIAMAANPKIRVIRIADASLLDSASQAIIVEMARTHDFQVWEEIVDESKKVGIVIEDGAVVAVNA